MGRGLQADLGLQGAWLLHRAFERLYLLRRMSVASQAAARL